VTYQPFIGDYLNVDDDALITVVGKLAKTISLDLDHTTLDAAESKALLDLLLDLDVQVKRAVRRG
jgi:hypothetical protein